MSALRSEFIIYYYYSVDTRTADYILQAWQNDKYSLTETIGQRDLKLWCFRLFWQNQILKLENPYNRVSVVLIIGSSTELNFDDR